MSDQPLRHTVIRAVLLATILTYGTAAHAVPVGFEFTGRVSQTGPGSIFTNSVGSPASGRIVFDSDDLLSTTIFTATTHGHNFAIPPAEFSVSVFIGGTNQVDVIAGEVPDSDPDFEIRLFNLPGSGPDLTIFTGFDAKSFRDLNGQPALTRLQLSLGGANSVDSLAVPEITPDFSRFTSVTLIADAVDATDGNLSSLFALSALTFEPIQFGTVPEPGLVGLTGLAIIAIAALRKRQEHDPVQSV